MLVKRTFAESIKKKKVIILKDNFTFIFNFRISRTGLISSVYQNFSSEDYFIEHNVVFFFNPLVLMISFMLQIIHKWCDSEE